ncbi:hypothetical protein YC2023_048864 [Brassica napus]
MWGGTYSIGSGKVEFTLALGPKPFDISSALHEGRRLRAFLWIFLMKFLRGTNLRECSRFRARGLTVSHLIVVLFSSAGEVSWQRSCALIANRCLLLLLGLKIVSLVASCAEAVLCMVLERVSLVEQF